MAFLMLISLILVGCSAPTPPAPTALPTANNATLVAAAVSTISAQMTLTAIANPSPTPSPLPTATETPTPTVTPIPPTPTLNVSPTPSATEPLALAAKALSAGTFPEAKVDYVPNEKFGLALRYQNVGTVAWEPGYRLKLVGHKGEITVQPEAEMQTRVEPGGKIEFDLWGFGSETLGEHIWYFQLFTGSGVPVPGGAISFRYTSH